MPTELQVVDKKLDRVVSTVDYMRGQFDLIFPTIVTRDNLVAEVSRLLSQHIRDCPHSNASRSSAIFNSTGDKPNVKLFLALVGIVSVLTTGLLTIIYKLLS